MAHLGDRTAAKARNQTRSDTYTEYTYVEIHILRTCICVRICIYTDACMYVRTCVCMYVFGLLVCIHVDMRITVFTWKYMCTCIQSCICRYVYVLF